MKSLSLDLRAEFPDVEGFSWSNLYKIRKWYLFYSSQSEILYQLGTKIQTIENTDIQIPDIPLLVPWRHQTVIVSKCDTIQAALFYLNKVIEGNMSRAELEHAIEAKLYEYTGKALNNFAVTLPQPQNELASEMLKDPYKLDFISMKGKFDERDMVFYHTRLKCYVVIELKVVDFMPEFIGKLNFYVSAADELLKGDDDNPSIGILLCKDKDSSVVEWSLRGITTPLGVASYQLQEVYDRTMLEMKLQASKGNED